MSQPLTKKRVSEREKTWNKTLKKIIKLIKLNKL